MGHIMQTFPRGGLWDIYNKFMYVRMHVCTYVCMHVCTYVRMYVCTQVCTYVRTYVYIYYLCMYVYIYVELNPPNGDIMGIFYGRMGYSC